MEVEGGLRAVLMDFGSARIARVAVRERREALAVQDSAAEECTAPFRAPELWDTPSQCDLVGEGLGRGGFNGCLHSASVSIQRVSALHGCLRSAGVRGCPHVTLHVRVPYTFCRSMLRDVRCLRLRCPCLESDANSINLTRDTRCLLYLNPRLY